MQTPTATVRLRITSRSIQRCLKLNFPRDMWSTSSTSTSPLHLDLTSIDPRLENFLSTLSAFQSRLVRFHQSRMRSGVAQVGIQAVTHTRDSKCLPSAWPSTPGTHPGSAPICNLTGPSSLTPPWRGIVTVAFLLEFSHHRRRRCRFYYCRRHRSPGFRGSGSAPAAVHADPGVGLRDARVRAADAGRRVVDLRPSSPRVSL
ncbi:hypothetical protein CH63R_11732 [Colletotrichum higginsianum IMI 349063]|uniref:Uncharacterized protein n=1 Tax=Colletotrichum higginsianum (strain IMI 349063) TaxID=759273 RepID=A0A1B7XZ60_COLHI|nr:hypothetical protein CH63R_11732 [Colletotrichum higginsianum IMI 349063]OBR05029.1 hypothetical protein CH63R_11732 [Colletotrichum higginsianum IMI 349063]